MLQLMCKGCSYTYPALSIARYSFIQMSEPEQCRVKKLAQGFNTAAQDSNPGSRSRESEDLPLSHCVLLWRAVNVYIPLINEVKIRRRIKKERIYYTYITHNLIDGSLPRNWGDLIMSTSGGSAVMYNLYN